jgi:hypothetical protein
MKVSCNSFLQRLEPLDILRFFGAERVEDRFGLARRMHAPLHPDPAIAS